MSYKVGDRVLVGPSPRGRVLGGGTILALIEEGRPITMNGDTFDNPSLLLDNGQRVAMHPSQVEHVAS
jgi:hypothetical protein